MDITNVALEEELEACKRQLAAESEEKLRILADAENFKKRLAREKEEFLKFAAEGVVADMLPVLDNLGLALEHGRDNEACKNLYVGVDMTRKIFLETLARHGLEEFGAPGEEFNPELHEAMGMADGTHFPSLDDGQIGRVIQRGYKLRGRLLRPAKVMVVKK